MTRQEMSTVPTGGGGGCSIVLPIGAAVVAFLFTLMRPSRKAGK